MSLTSLSALFRAKYQAYPGVPTGLTFDDLERTYFQVRSGLAANPRTPKVDYMHTLFDNLSIEPGEPEYRQRKMFILESGATEEEGWLDAARIWAQTP